ncbi:hypothetical protein D3C73_1303210 [compost metagenome]
MPSVDAFLYAIATSLAAISGALMRVTFLLTKFISPSLKALVDFLSSINPAVNLAVVLLIGYCTASVALVQSNLLITSVESKESLMK